MKLDSFFEIINPKYIYLEIIPHKAVVNHNSANIAKAISLSYKAIKKRIRIEKKKLFFEMDFKISYCIEIKGKQTHFYFIVPNCFKIPILEKLKEIWGKCTIKEVEPLEGFMEGSDTMQLSYKNDDFMSIGIDKRGSLLLNDNLTAVEVMEKNDRVVILYNFIPSKNLNWNIKYNSSFQKWKKGKPILKDKKSSEYLIQFFTSLLFDSFNMIIESLAEFFGVKKKINTGEAMAESIATVLFHDKKEISSETKKKKTSMVVDTQILVNASSEDRARQYNILDTVCQSFRVVDYDNELIYKKADRPKNFELREFKGVDKNICSTDELCNFIQLPTKDTLKNLNLNYTKIEENNISEKLTKGVKRLGNATLKGRKIPVFLEEEYNIGNLPLIEIGTQGGGKTTFLAHYLKDSVNNGESAVVIDYIKKCELSETIKEYIPKDKIVEIDLSTEEGLQGLGFNEIKIVKDMTVFLKLKHANTKALQLITLIDSISARDKLSPRMRNPLLAASMVVFVQGFDRVQDVVQCLENHEKRHAFIRSLTNLERDSLEEEIKVLYSLDEYSKGNKNEPPSVIGTKESRIEFILDRISLLREDFKLKYMYKKDLTNNIDLVDIMEKGKVLLIKMREDEFPTASVKNILVTYWISKIWLAVQLRGSKHEKPLRTNIIVDEIFQAPTSLEKLIYIVPQSRKFGCKFIFTAQYLAQFEALEPVLESCGATYMLLKGCLEKDFNHFKPKINNLEYEDLQNMKLHYSLNIVSYSGGYESFITKLPYDK